MVFRVGTAFAHIALLQADRRDAALQAADREIPVALDRFRHGFILPLHRDGVVHAGGMPLQTDEGFIRRRQVRQTNVDAGLLPLLR